MDTGFSAMCMHSDQAASVNAVYMQTDKKERTSRHTACVLSMRFFIGCL